MTPRTMALVSDMVALLHFCDDPVQQTGSDHFVLAKLRPDVPKKASRSASAMGLAACIMGLAACIKRTKAQFQKSWDAWKAWARLEEVS